jgi:hypothetical protein
LQDDDFCSHRTAVPFAASTCVLLICW